MILHCLKESGVCAATGITKAVHLWHHQNSTITLEETDFFCDRTNDLDAYNDRLLSF